ncbi:hypothetical protein LVY72_18170 [Arthrobacter sp. I2-34]|uniref:Uncharacterized protein n=1 Tax=Arthrobacter hankyongi TaxID=2904801 RepID=A0ABS9LBC8_9MICC|nr:hypothetical protein [Arthrobacter hankyongi]MCG2623823.1 hypothetical protein [Arthrobacter hankyongi]
MGFEAGFTEDRPKVPWQTRAAPAALLLVPVMLAGAAISTPLPVWWATLIGSQVGGDQIGGDPGGSILAGMCYGFTFTLLPLLLAWRARGDRLGGAWKAAILAAALVLAAPNLLTAGIAAGPSGSAYQARRILGVQAAWFTTWTLYSAIAAALMFTATVVLWTAWRRGRTLERAGRKIIRRG